MDIEAATVTPPPIDAVIDRVREALLPDFALERDLAAAFRVCTRTIQRANLPSVKIGYRRYYHLPTARERLLRRPPGA